MAPDPAPGSSDTGGTPPSTGGQTNGVTRIEKRARSAAPVPADHPQTPPETPVPAALDYDYDPASAGREVVSPGELSIFDAHVQQLRDCDLPEHAAIVRGVLKMFVELPTAQSQSIAISEGRYPRVSCWLGIARKRAVASNV